MFELAPEMKPPCGQMDPKPAAPLAAPTTSETRERIILSLSLDELDALTDIVLNAPPTKLVDDEMAEHLLRRLMQIQREQLFTNPA